MIETRFTALVGASAPIQAAPMPAISTVELVAAVANAGAVGMLGAPMLSAEFLDPACVAVAARRAQIVEFFYGDPQRALVDEAHAFGALVGWQVGSLDEAIAAERAGCDFVVVQGTEAGGHVRGQTSLLPLLSEVLDALRVPVLAAGGIATARDLAAVLAAGASGARIGTRFVAAAESGAHPLYVKALLSATAADTCLTEAYSVGWPDAPHRVLRSAIAAAELAQDDILGEEQWGGEVLPIVTGQVDAVYVGAAWVFVVFRALHSAVHCTINVIIVRFNLYLVSTLAVWFMAARAAIHYLAS